MRKVYATILLSSLCLVFSCIAKAQRKLPVIKAASTKAVIKDGKYVALAWELSPALKPDTYFMNIPMKRGKVRFITDQDELTFRTEPGSHYDFVVLLNGKDSCHVRISSVHPPTGVSVHTTDPFPQTIPFTLVGSRVYFKGAINGKEVNIQVDLGAGTNAVNKGTLDKLGLVFSERTIVSNTNGVNEARTSTGNELRIGGVTWTGIPVTEVGNMQPYEDLIIGNGLFRDKIIEIDYDSKEFIIHAELPSKARSYAKQPVYYEQDRPRFEAELIHKGKKYSFWFLFDTGRDGTMLIGEDFTGKDHNWQELDPLMMINGRKIVRLDARIAGMRITDIVTNAADPSNPQNRPTLFGNQLLNHFNVILDNRSGNVYLKPNGRTDEPYSDYKSYLKEVSEMQKK